MTHTPNPAAEALIQEFMPIIGMAIGLPNRTNREQRKGAIRCAMKCVSQIQTGIHEVDWMEVQNLDRTNAYYDSISQYLQSELQKLTA